MLDLCNSIKDFYFLINDTKVTLDPQGEINVTVGVNDVDPMIPPHTCVGGQSCDPPLLVLLNPVHICPFLMEISNLVHLAGVVKFALGGGSLSDVGTGHRTILTILSY